MLRYILVLLRSAEDPEIEVPDERPEPHRGHGSRDARRHPAPGPAGGRHARRGSDGGTRQAPLRRGSPRLPDVFDGPDRCQGGRCGRRGHLHVVAHSGTTRLSLGATGAGGPTILMSRQAILRIVFIL